jgi:predicted anti-sigma-YlaC factor YlaD
MNPCDSCGAELSALIDGEAEPEVLLAALDHLTACASCRAFYRQARALAGALARVQAPPQAGTAEPPPPPGLWRRIEARAGEPWWRPLTRRPAWAAAAALALALTAAWLGVVDGPRTRDTPATVAEVRLGRTAGEMTDERFFALTIEVLESDRRYREALSRVLEEVDRYAGTEEVSTEGAAATSETPTRPRL